MPALVEHLGLHQLHQAAPQLQFVHGGHRLQQLVGKLAPHGGPQLRHRFHRPGDPGAPSGSRGAWPGSPAGAAARQRIAILPLLEQAELQHHLGQLFDKQRHPIGLATICSTTSGSAFLRHSARHLRGLARGAWQRHWGRCERPVQGG